MGGTGMFLIWVLMLLLEVVVLFVASWANVCVPKELVENLKQGYFDPERPLKIIGYKSRLNYGFISIVVSTLMEIVFAIMIYVHWYSGAWYEHILLIFLIIATYMIITFLLFFAVLVGELIKRSSLKKYYKEEHNVAIT